VTVRFAELVAQGVGHHAPYLVGFEMARIEYLRRFRGGYASLREEASSRRTTSSIAERTGPSDCGQRLIEKGTGAEHRPFDPWSFTLRSTEGGRFQRRFQRACEAAHSAKFDLGSHRFPSGGS
jgi:hypothetical protein